MIVETKETTREEERWNYGDIILVKNRYTRKFCLVAFVPSIVGDRRDKPIAMATLVSLDTGAIVLNDRTNTYMQENGLDALKEAVLASYDTVKRFSTKDTKIVLEDY